MIDFYALTSPNVQKIFIMLEDCGLPYNLKTVDVWKDARLLGKTAGEAAVQLCKNPDPAKVKDTSSFKTPGGIDVTSILLKPQAITQDNLNVVLDAGWIQKADLCQGVAAGKVAACG